MPPVVVMLRNGALSGRVETGPKEVVGVSEKILREVILIYVLRQVEGALAFLDSGEQPLPHDVDIRVVGEL